MKLQKNIIMLVFVIKEYTNMKMCLAKILLEGYYQKKRKKKNIVNNIFNYCI
jgi:hypothetical protein